MGKVKLLSTLRFDDDLLARIRGVSDRVEVTQVACHNDREVADVLGEHADVEVLYAFHVPHQVLDLARRLRWLQLHSAGADHLLDHPIMRSEVPITTTSGIHATPIAEYVFATILAYRWQVPRWTHCQREREWPSGRWKLYARPELRGSTLGILGYGSIGREVGRLGRAFGMRVLALRRTEGTLELGYAVDGTGDPDGTMPDRFYASDAVLEMLAECDYVVVALPLTEATKGSVGELELRAMKPTAYLVNIARGAVVDESALIRALREGWIGGAGLDVFEQEPLPQDSPLWDAESALLSPHVAGFTPCYDARAVALFTENLARYLDGRPLLNLVDKARGY